jgi:hypothetical protein
VAGKKFQRQKKAAADSAPNLGQKGQKSGRKKMFGDKAGFLREGSRKILIINVKWHLLPLSVTYKTGTNPLIKQLRLALASI